MASKNILAFVPVLHEGYRRFFEKHKEGATLYILGPELISEHEYLAKEIRMLDPSLMQKSIQALDIFNEVKVANRQSLEEIRDSSALLVVPREDIMEDLVKKYFSDKRVTFDSIFLRWDKHNTVAEKPVSPDQKISSKEFDKEMLRLAETEAKKSSDFWRHVGSIIVKDGEVIITTHNEHVPSEHMPYVNGDPRNNFHKGVRLELSTSVHSEAGAIAEAARQGISLEGASLYVSTFPCPPCAKLVAYSGIKKIFYRSGYGVLDGEDIFKSQGVEIVFVEE